MINNDLLELTAPGVHEMLNIIVATSLILKPSKNPNTIIWKDYNCNISNEFVLSDDLIEKIINDFWLNEVNKILDNQHIIVLFRIVTSDNLFFTLGHLQSLNKKDKDWYKEYIIDILSLKNEEYREMNLKSIIFSYGVRDGIETQEKSTLKSIESKTKYQFYKHYKLPVAFDPLKYGKLIKIFGGNHYLIQITLTTSAIIHHNGNKNEVEIFKNGKIILKFTDQLLSDNTILRTIGKNNYRYNLDGQLLLLEVTKPVKYINNIKPQSKKDNKIITMDIETFIENNEQIPYLVSWYDGFNLKSFYLTDFISPDEMLKTAILSLCNKKYNHYKVYFHNFGNFDGIFLLKILVELGFCKPIIHHGKLVCIFFKYDNKISLHFRDSYQILLSSLSKLCLSFNINDSKLIFPYNFVTRNNLNYTGEVPNIQFFDNISKENYNNYKNNYKNWNLR